MRQPSPESKGDTNGQKGRPAFTGTWNILEDHSESDCREVRNQVKSFNNPRNQGREQAITRHSGLILDLRQIQPASICEIAEVTGQSLSATRNRLRQLTQLNLVIKTSFEHHTLYCLNGCYNVQVSRVLAEYFE